MSFSANCSANHAQQRPFADAISEKLATACSLNSGRGTAPGKGRPSREGRAGKETRQARIAWLCAHLAQKCHYTLFAGGQERHKEHPGRFDRVYSGRGG